MKYVIVQGDGMGDLLKREENKPTALETARTPNMDRIAGCGQFGLIHTVPTELPPGSDVGHLSLFGYNPIEYYTGRSPLEAIAMGVELGPEDIAFRLNLVCLSGEAGAEVMADYSAGHIENGPARELVEDMGRELGDATFQFYPGISYRHLLVWRGGLDQMETTPPHDISDQAIAPHLPKGEGAQELVRLMEGSRGLLADHPVNQARIAKGLAPVSQAWLWGQGKALQLPAMQQVFHLRGAVISAVDLVRGVAMGAGCDIIHVPGATGYLDTDYAAKGQYALTALEDHDLVLIHIEAPDEAGHMGNFEEKVKAIESIDEKIVGPLLESLPALGAFKIMIVSDHATPVSLRTHCHDPVPFAIATGDQLAAGGEPIKYGESEAEKTGSRIQPGYKMMEQLIAYPE